MRDPLEKSGNKKHSQPTFSSKCVDGRRARAGCEAPPLACSSIELCGRYDAAPCGEQQPSARERGWRARADPATMTRLQSADMDRKHAIFKQESAHT